MVKIIFLSMAIFALSFIAAPIFHGVSKERNAILASNDFISTQDDSLSFDEIYALADEGRDEAEFLNNIAPAASGQEDAFTSGFRGLENSALEDTAPTEMQQSDLEN